MNHNVFRTFISLLFALVFSFAGFSPALAAAPANDNFLSAQSITSSPFSATVDLTEATLELNEPQVCKLIDKSVWYSFTPTQDTLVQAKIEGTLLDANMNVYQATGPGIDNLSFTDCAVLNYPRTFMAQAGQTYYLQIGTTAGIDGTITLNFIQFLDEGNDNFANAASIDSIPFVTTFLINGANQESGEPIPSCAYFAPPYATIWYVIHATQEQTLTASLNSAQALLFMAVYSGTDFTNLSQLGCEPYGFNPVTFQTVPGQTYYIQLGNHFGDIAGSTLSVQPAPPPVADFIAYTWNPASNQPVQFYDNSYDPANLPIVAWNWNFGDGSTSTELYPVHSYTADGDYPITLIVVTVDGRTGSVTKTIEVRTHDVSITKIAAPLSANVGQTRPITVSVRNNAYPETVRVDLYKIIAGGNPEWIGMSTQFVPVRSGNRTSQFTFNYTFSLQDAQAGKVTFKAVAFLENTYDAHPADNEAISSHPTIVKR